MKLFFLFSSDLVPKQEQKPPVQESTPTKPVQSVAPQARDSSAVSACESGSLVDLWDGSSAPPTNVAQPAKSSQSSNLVDLMGDVLHDNIPPSTAAASGRPQPLLSFDEMMDGTFCSGTGAEDDPSSLVDVTGSDQMTLSYQHALQHASGEGQELDDGQLLMTNGEALLKEGTQVSQVMLLVLSGNNRSDSRLIGRRFAHLLSLCWCFRRARATSANHRRRNSGHQRSPQLNPHRSFITSPQVRRSAEIKLLLATSLLPQHIRFGRLVKTTIKGFVFYWDSASLENTFFPRNTRLPTSLKVWVTLDRMDILRLHSLFGLDWSVNWAPFLIGRFGRRITNICFCLKHQKLISG